MLITETSKNTQTSSNNGDAKLVLSTKHTANGFSFLKQIKLKQVSFWDFTSNVIQAESTKFKFKLVKLQDLIRQRKGFFTIDDGQEYKRCKVQLYAKGVILRDIVKGDEIKTKKQQLCKKDDFLVAEIDAKVGGYGIVPSELENAVVSSHYYLYEIDSAQLLPEFLGLYVKTEEFAKQIKASGSTNYASIRPAQVLDYQIPLPPIATQEKLVADYNAQMLQAAQFEATAKVLEQEIETYLLKELGIKIQQTEKKKGLQITNLRNLSRWNVEYLFNLENAEHSFSSKYKTVKFAEISKSVGGGTPPKNIAEFWKGEIPWVSPKDMKTDFLTKTQDYISESAVKRSSAPLLESGYLIFVMRSGILQDTVPVAINRVQVSINQDLRAFKIISDDLNTDFLLRYFQNIQKILLRLVKTGTTVQSIDSKRLEDLQIVIPPLEVQTKIVKHINTLKTKIKTLKTDAENLRNRAKGDFESELFEM